MPCGARSMRARITDASDPSLMSAFRSAPGPELARRLVEFPAAGSVTIVGATIIDGSGSEPQREMSMVVRDGFIAEIRPRRAPEGPTTDDQVLDWSGLFVTPGLIDCHVHLNGLHTDESGIERYPLTRVLRAAADAQRVLAAGFLTVRHLGHGSPAHAQAIRDAVADGLIPGPRMLTSGWAISQTGGHGTVAGWPYDLVEHLRPRSTFADGPDECRQIVRRIIGDGADCIKIYATEGVLTTPMAKADLPNFTMAELKAMTDEAHQSGKRVAAHATGSTGARQAVRAGVDTIEHGPASVDDELLELMDAHGTTFVPTLSLFEWAATAPEVPPGARDRVTRQLDERRAMAGAARRGGVRLAVGSDGAGERLGTGANELAALVRAGCSPLEALRAATFDSAAALGLPDLGTLRQGQRAEMLAFTRDPAADITVVTDPKALRFIALPAAAS